MLRKFSTGERVAVFTGEDDVALAYHGVIDSVPLLAGGDYGVRVSAVEEAVLVSANTILSLDDGDSESADFEQLEFDVPGETDSITGRYRGRDGVECAFAIENAANELLSAELTPIESSVGNDRLRLDIKVPQSMKLDHRKCKPIVWKLVFDLVLNG